jgi:DNA-binding CsgD family transcriptional regulator/ligand-binding sensor protein
MDCFYKIAKIGIAILDLKGNILVATGWQDICTKFHRIHPNTSRNCLESDIFLSGNVEQGKYVLYKCKNNMWDMSTPIFAGDTHIANLFLGQFFFDDELPDYEVFVIQAKMYGFDEREYLAALKRVPRWSRETVQNVMDFYTRFADMVSRLSYGNLKLVKLLSEQKQAEEETREANSALKVLLKQRQEDRTELEESLLRNVKHLVVPYLEKLKGSRLDSNQRNFLEIMESHLREITSPFVQKISAPMLGLTPTEIRVADLIRQGKSSKEIADLLGISENAVIFHRQGIRRKLGLTGRKLNLQTYLGKLK